METPPSPLALFVRLALDPEKSRAPAFAWHSFERDPVTWSYARTYRAAAAAAAKVSNVVGARGAPPPKVSPLQTSPEHRAHCVGVFVSEGPGLLLLTLAVGLCGCAFVPLSKHDPPRRLAAAMRDAAVSLAVVDDDFAARRARDALAILSRDETSGGTESDALEVRVLNLSELLDVGAFEDASSAESGDDATRLKTETNAPSDGNGRARVGTRGPGPRCVPRAPPRSRLARVLHLREHGHAQRVRRDEKRPGVVRRGEEKDARTRFLERRFGSEPARVRSLARGFLRLARVRGDASRCAQRRDSKTTSVCVSSKRKRRTSPRRPPRSVQSF
jgi:hypothetical protein